MWCAHVARACSETAHPGRTGAATACARGPCRDDTLLRQISCICPALTDTHIDTARSQTSTNRGHFFSTRGTRRRDLTFAVMPKTFMVKKHRRHPATSSPIAISVSGWEMTSRGVPWTPWRDSPVAFASGHVTQQTGRALLDVGQLTGVTSLPVNRRHGTLWSPYLDVKYSE